MQRAYVVYILRSLKFSNQIYKGFTEQDVFDRLTDHNAGKCKHTEKYRPWELIFYCAFDDKYRALAFEKYLKTASGIAFIKKRLIKK
ncbi:GIY-YIG nuclease family protein [Candidatus Kuenenbacteria bacterium]|nr:GIY-YIG nuclease family protein [Candidatus Kuenenbacteria bacterium]